MEVCGSRRRTKKMKHEKTFFINFNIYFPLLFLKQGIYEVF